MPRNFALLSRELCSTRKFGSKYTPRAAIRSRVASSRKVPCSIVVQPAMMARPRPFRGVRMNHRTQADLARLAAGGVDLIRGHGHFAAVPDARRGEQLDHVRAVRLELVHQRADLLRIAALLRDLLQ